jgi:hypothetical protein
MIGRLSMPLMLINSRQYIYRRLERYHKLEPEETTTIRI